MSEITLHIPDALTGLPKQEQAILMGRALRSAVEERVIQVEEEIREGQAYLEQYEKKYGLSFVAYEKKINDLEFVGVDYQEDYNDWYFWTECVQRAQGVLINLRQFLSP